MKFENTRVFNFEGALHGMRNPLESWEKSDSDFSDACWERDPALKCEECRHFAGFGAECAPLIGENDMALAQRLIRGGSEHRKFLRQIFISVDITAPLYWWKEFDTYKIGTTANSTSTMHKLASQPITRECFETDDYHPELIVPAANYPWEPDFEVGDYVDDHIGFLERLRQKYLETKDKRYWKELVRWLPESWLQTRTITMNYETVSNIVHQRKNHKLNEWSGRDDLANPNFIAWAKSLPYAAEFIFLNETERDEQ